MTTFIGTFGIGHLRHRCYQPIQADTAELAAQHMADRHGYDWSTIYPLEEYKSLQDLGHFKGHQPLPTLGVETAFTDIVQQFFDRRYSEIMTSRSPFISKQERLQILQQDICSAYREKPAERPHALLRDIELQLC
ncbi:hypothetical protein [Sporosarcina trichiuri]|uniref:hypothetical protein n=1 Tax=Sporosarcina trichiuri TaxID=3056445 RepID=UPI0025B32581|nr:hypothetical protein [Sporosarcina sp. 0.2-SM1T-5]WJY27419.1 hypothetical protein QWT68_15480 [Sporosarcina sp. 0.2-SM1T-5]